MKQYRLPNTDIKTEIVRFFGGIDQSSPALDIKTGNALDAVNYEPGLLGGYRRIDGYERRDGRPAPSKATYLYLEGSFAQVATPLAIKGATSGASATVVFSKPGLMCLAKVSGAFQNGETITNVALNPLGVLAIVPAVRGCRSAIDDATALAAAADLYRADIGALPGSGSTLGAWMFNGTLYGFRNNAGGTAAVMYRETAAGWAAVPLGQQMQIQQPSESVTTSSGAVNWNAHGLAAGALVQFAGSIPSGVSANTSYYVVNPTANTFQVATGAGGTAITLGAIASGLTVVTQAQAIAEGATVTGERSGATGVVARVALRTGATPSFGMTATLVLSSAAGAFQVGEVLKVAGAPVAAAASVNAAITLKPSGNYQFFTYTFTGSIAQRRMYFCDGVNPAMEFDGTTLVPIYTGMVVDAPQYLAAHKGKLFLAFDSMVQHSGDGVPYQWTVLAGANQFGVGDTVTGLAEQPGDTLAIFARNSCYQLNGSTVSDFQLLPISPEIGAIARTVQVIGKTFGLDDRGIIVTDRTQAYGNFVQSTISLAVQPMVDTMRSKAVGSMVYRNRNQYRIYGSDGSGIICTFGDQGLVGITRLLYPVSPTCFANCEDASGNDSVFFGDTLGYVYQADVGSSFDGQAIESYLRLPFNNLSSPRVRKRFRKAVMEMSAIAYTSIRFQPEFSYGVPDVSTHRTQVGEVTGTGGYWDVDSWEGFFFDAQLVSSPAFSIEGTGLNMGLVFYSKSNIDLGHTLQGVLLHFSLRRLER